MPKIKACHLTVILIIVMIFVHHSHAVVSPHNTIKCSLNSNPLSTTNNISMTQFLGTNLPIPYYDPSIYSYDMIVESLKLVNISNVRIPIHWAILEPTQGVLLQEYVNRIDSALDKMNNAGIKSLFFFVGSPKWISTDPTTTKSDVYPPSSLTPYTDRLIWLIERYAKKGLEVVQIWNEVNLPGFWMPMEDPQAYTNLLNSSYTRAQQFISNTSHPEYNYIKNVKISMAGMAYFSEMPYHSQQPMFYALEPLKAYNKCDVVAYHPYYSTPEGSVPTDVYDFETKAKEIAYPLLAKYGKRIFATEWGWSTYSKDFSEQPFITELEQADYVVRRLTMLMHLCFDRVYHFAMYDFPDSVGASQRDTYYGLLRCNMTVANGGLDSSKSNFENINRMAKPSYIALSNYMKFIGNQKKLFGVSNVFVPVNDPGNMHSITVHNGEGSLLWFYWAKQSATGIKLNSQPIKDMIKMTGYNMTRFVVLDPVSGKEIPLSVPTDLDNIKLDVQTSMRIAKFSFAVGNSTNPTPQVSTITNNSTNSNSTNNPSTSKAVSGTISYWNGNLSWILVICLSLISLFALQ